MTPNSLSRQEKPGAQPLSSSDFLMNPEPKITGLPASVGYGGRVSGTGPPPTACCAAAGSAQVTTAAVKRAAEHLHHIFFVIPAKARVRASRPPAASQSNVLRDAPFGRSSG